jgi:hypothetical protein
VDFIQLIFRGNIKSQKSTCSCQQELIMNEKLKNIDSLSESSEKTIYVEEKAPEPWIFRTPYYDKDLPMPEGEGPIHMASTMIPSPLLRLKSPVSELSERYEVGRNSPLNGMDASKKCDGRSFESNESLNNRIFADISLNASDEVEVTDFNTEFDKIARNQSHDENRAKKHESLDEKYDSKDHEQHILKKTWELSQSDAQNSFNDQNTRLPNVGYDNANSEAEYSFSKSLESNDTNNATDQMNGQYRITEMGFPSKSCETPEDLSLQGNMNRTIINDNPKRNLSDQNVNEIDNNGGFVNQLTDSNSIDIQHDTRGYDDRSFSLDDIYGKDIGIDQNFDKNDKIQNSNATIDTFEDESSLTKYSGSSNVPENLGSLHLQEVILKNTYHGDGNISKTNFNKSDNLTEKAKKSETFDQSMYEDKHDYIDSKRAMDNSQGDSIDKNGPSEKKKNTGLLEIIKRETETSSPQLKKDIALRSNGVEIENEYMPKNEIEKFRPRFKSDIAVGSDVEEIENVDTTKKEIGPSSSRPKHDFALESDTVEIENVDMTQNEIGPSSPRFKNDVALGSDKVEIENVDLAQNEIDTSSPQSKNEIEAEDAEETKNLYINRYEQEQVTLTHSGKDISDDDSQLTSHFEDKIPIMNLSQHERQKEASENELEENTMASEPIEKSSYSEDQKISQFVQPKMFNFEIESHSDSDINIPIRKDEDENRSTNESDWPNSGGTRNSKQQQKNDDKIMESSSQLNSVKLFAESNKKDDTLQDKSNADNLLDDQLLSLFESQLKSDLKYIHDHLNENAVTTDMYAPQLFETLRGNDSPERKSPELIIQMALSILNSKSSEVLSFKSKDELLDFLNSGLFSDGRYINDSDIEKWVRKSRNANDLLQELTIVIKEMNDEISELTMAYNAQQQKIKFLQKELQKK